MSLDPITAILNIVDDVVSGVTADQKAKLALQLQALDAAAKAQEGQLQVNAAEASNSNLFVSGWRPYIGWGLGTIVVLYAFLTLITNELLSLGYHVIAYPPLDPMVRDIVLGLLGLNIGSRSFEKWKGVARNNMSDS